MYIGHYKSVSSSGEFYTKEREQLNFPAQVEYKGERYSLFRTIMCDTPLKKQNLIKIVDKYNISYDVEIDKS